jgi:hypothetical protein
MLLLETVYYIIKNGELNEFKRDESFIPFTIIDMLDTRYHHIVSKINKNDFSYTIVPQDEIPELADGTVVVKFIDYGSADELELSVIHDYQNLIKSIKSEYYKDIADELYDEDDPSSEKDWLFDDEDGFDDGFDDDEEENEDDDDFDELDFDDNGRKKSTNSSGKPNLSKKNKPQRSRDVYGDEYYLRDDHRERIDEDFLPGEWEDYD